MTTAKIQTSFASGEISPTLWGRVDLAKFHVGASTIRNMYVDYRGGATSRGGTAFVGASLTAGASLPPRLIPFTFNIQSGQTYVLEFGNRYIRFIQNGAYLLEAAKAITGITSASPAQITAPGHGFGNGDWVYISGVNGMTRINGKTAVVHVVDLDHILLYDVFGSNINSIPYGAYISGGTVARYYTLSTPYAISDVPLLKYDQSADVMTICHQSYPPYDLKRLGATNWSLVKQSFSASISPPATITSWANTWTTSANDTTFYMYCVTSIDMDTGEESIAGPVTTVTNSVDIATTAGSNDIAWSYVSKSGSYNIYKAPAIHGASFAPAGMQYGYMTSARGTMTVDRNIIPDYTKTPPLHQNPFATSSVSYITIDNGGGNYRQETVTAVISSSTGAGAVLLPIVQPPNNSSHTGSISSIVIMNGGEGYSPSDAVVISDPSGGAGAAATIHLNPATGTWPGVVSYFQQRRVYASTPNQPDTYFFSRPGAFKNMDVSSPTIDSDAIQGTPWSTQVNGISWMVSMPGGLVVLTGLGAWQVSGGQNGAAVTPASQNAQPQAYNGCSNTVPPVKIDYDILYVQQKGSQVYDLAYNFFTNIYTGTDITIISSHMFEKKTIKEWTWARSPHKILWSVQSDGSLLSLTFLKEQEVQGWARHDTNGLFQSITSVSEGTIDAVYMVVKRFVRGTWVYYVERMDARQWESLDDVFAVDCGLRYPQPTPNAILTASAATGTVTFTAASPVFTPANVGDVIRMGGGVAMVTAYNSAISLTGTITADIVEVLPDDIDRTPIPAAPGEWSITTPVTTIYWLDHLEGKQVAILADGSVVSSQAVTDGSITLPVAASAVVIGLSFVCQLQSLYADVEGGPTIQGKRKNIPGVTIRVSKSRGFRVGSNQADSSIQIGAVPQVWSGLVEVKDRSASVFAGRSVPLYTGDTLIRINPMWRKPGQVCVQQDYCLPLSITAFIPELIVGDDNG